MAQGYTEPPPEKINTARVILEVVVEGNMSHQKLADALRDSIHYDGRQSNYYEDNDSKWGLVKSASLVGFRNEEL